jgi:hypothetical protein
VLARAYYHQLYFLFFREPAVAALSVSELSRDVLLTDSTQLYIPSCMCGQVLLHCLKLLRSRPKHFADALLKNYVSIPIGLFAFSTFPALYQFFTAVESVEYGVQFVMHLLALRAPDDLVGALFQSLLFAVQPFSDALWAHFHSRFSARPAINEVVAISELTRSIDACAPLLPPKLCELVREVLAARTELCANAIVTFLRTTFQLWYSHCPEGMSFGCGPSFLKFLDVSRNFANGNSVTICDRFIRGRSYVPVYPFNCELCGMLSEAVILSHADFAVFRRAFDGAEQREDIFKAINIEEELGRFAPYLLDFFPNIDRRKNGLVNHLIFARKLGADSLFHPEVAAIREIMELEDLFRMQLILRHVRSFQRSVVRFRNAAFAHFCRQTLTPVLPRQMVEVASQILRHPREDRTLVGSLLPELLNVCILPEMPPDFLPRFWAMQKDYLADAWTEMMATPRHKFIIDLIPEATRRDLPGFGDVFLLFSHIFWVVRKFAKRNGYTEIDDPRKLKVMKFVSLNCQFAGILRVLLFFDKLVFQNNYFMASLSEKLVKDWNSFSQMMWSTLIKDVELSRDVSTFVQGQLPQ